MNCTFKQAQRRQFAQPQVASFGTKRPPGAVKLANSVPIFCDSAAALALHVGDLADEGILRSARRMSLARPPGAEHVVSDRGRIARACSTSTAATNISYQRRQREAVECLPRCWWDPVVLRLTMNTNG